MQTTTVNAARRDPEQLARAALAALGPQTTHSQLVNQLGEECLDVPLELYERLRRQLWGAPKNGRAPRRSGHNKGCPPRSDGQCAALVEVARGLPEPFSLALLTIRAWEKYPELFGLPGFTKFYPSDHRVSGALFAGSGPLRRGLMRKEGGGYVVVQAVEG